MQGAPFLQATGLGRATIILRRVQRKFDRNLSRPMQSGAGCCEGALMAARDVDAGVT